MSDTPESKSRPPTVCCPHCGQLVDLVEKGYNYPCERCGVAWRWYKQLDSVEVQEETK